MSYSSLNAMRNSGGLQARIIACAAQEDIEQPETWVSINMWKIVAREDWIARWDDATVNYNPMLNPDTGARPDVITDNHILTAVQDVNQV